MSDIIDSRDLEEELKTLDPKEDKEEIKEILELKKEVSSYGGDSWEHGIIFISEYEWKYYCENFAEEVGYIDNLDNNPLQHCIDWDQWADNMSMDYSSVEFRGQSYYYR